MKVFQLWCTLITLISTNIPYHLKKQTLYQLSRRVNQKKGERLSVNTTKFLMIWRWSMHSCFDIFYCINLWRIQVMIFIFISSHSSLLAKGFWFAPLLTNVHGDQIPLASKDASHLAFRFLLFSFKFPPCLSQRRKKTPNLITISISSITSIDFLL